MSSRTTSSSRTPRSWTTCRASRTRSPGPRTSRSPRPTRATSSAAAAASRRGSTNGTTLAEPGNDSRAPCDTDRALPRGSLREQGQRARGRRVRRYGGDDRYLFVGSERSNLDLRVRAQGLADRGNSAPRYLQVLPTGVGPEGLLAIPSATCSSSPARSTTAATRSARRSRSTSAPASRLPDGGVGRPLVRRRRFRGARSPGSRGRRRNDVDQLYTIHDSFYQQSRIDSFDIGQEPALIDGEIVMEDTQRRAARRPSRFEGATARDRRLRPDRHRQRRRHGQPRPRGHRHRRQRWLLDRLGGRGQPRQRGQRPEQPPVRASQHAGARVERHHRDDRQGRVQLPLESDQEPAALRLRGCRRSAGRRQRVRRLPARVDGRRRPGGPRPHRPLRPERRDLGLRLLPARDPDVAQRRLGRTRPRSRTSVATASPSSSATTRAARTGPSSASTASPSPG